MAPSHGRAEKGRSSESRTRNSQSPKDLFSLAEVGCSIGPRLEVAAKSRLVGLTKLRDCGCQYSAPDWAGRNSVILDSAGARLIGRDRVSREHHRGRMQDYQPCGHFRRSVSWQTSGLSSNKCV